MAVRTSPNEIQAGAPDPSETALPRPREAQRAANQAPFPAPAVLLPLQPAGHRWGYTAASVLPFLPGGRADHA